MTAQQMVRQLQNKSKLSYNYCEFNAGDTIYDFVSASLGFGKFEICEIKVSKQDTKRTFDKKDYFTKCIRPSKAYYVFPNVELAY